jgi:hypothetical protein
VDPFGAIDEDRQQRCCSLDEAANRLSLSSKTLREWLAKNPGYHATPGRKIIISPGDLSRIYEAMKDARRPKSERGRQNSSKASTKLALTEAQLYDRLLKRRKPKARRET